MDGGNGGWRWYANLLLLSALGTIIGIMLELFFSRLGRYINSILRSVVQLIVNALVIRLLELFMGEKFAYLLYNTAAGSYFFILLLAFQPNFYTPLIRLLLGHLNINE